MAVYGVTRVSTADQVEGTSLDEQRRKIHAIATVADLTVDHVFEDRGISGSVPLGKRPEGSKLFEVLQPGDTVIAYKIDRLFRNAADALATVQDWRDRGIDLIIAAFGADPVTANGVSKLLFGILAMTAEFERETIRERLAEGREAKRAMGGHIGGSAPFGYETVGEGRGAMLVPVPDQQDAIDRMVELRAAGKSFRAIAEAILDETGHKLSHVSVKTALLRRQDEEDRSSTA